MTEFDINNAATELLKRRASRQNLVDFVTYTKPDYFVNWHHEAICRELDRFSRGEIRKLMVFIPPQSGKSELSSRRFPAFQLGKKPDTKIAVCSYSPDLSMQFNREVQRIIQDPLYKNLFPQTTLNERNISSDAEGTYLKNAHIFEIVGFKGFYKSVGVGGPLTGTSVDIGIIDDPFKDRLEANSQRVRDNVFDWYTDVFKTRLHNDSQELLLMTRWHEDDLAGRLLLEDEKRAQMGLHPQWVVIKYPALKEEFTCPGDPREQGEALWPQKHSKESILDQRSKSERTFYSLYQQEPRPLEGNIIKTEKINIITWEQFLQRSRHRAVWHFKVDGAYTSKSQNDASAILASAFIDNCLYIRKSISVRKEFPEFCAFIAEFAKQEGYNHQSTIKVEPKANGISAVQSLKRSTQLNVQEFKYPRINGTRLDDKDKRTRAFAITEIVDSGRVYLIEGGWNKTLLSQLAAFPNGAHDDEVDVFVQDIIERFFEPERRYIKVHEGYVL